MSTATFEFGRIVFGEGAIEMLPYELEKLDLHKPFVVTTKSRFREVAAIRKLLGDSIAGVFDGAVEHVPLYVTEVAELQLAQSNADVILAIGGGSSIGLGKALVRRTALPLAAIPTTYSGSEMTTVYGETDEDGKQTGRDPRVLPRIVFYDPWLTVDLPAETSAASGLNALAHSVEALYAPNQNALSQKWAQESIRLLSRSLSEVIAFPSDIKARARALRGAQLAGEALNATSMGLHHRICHVLGGSYGLHHSKTHAVMLRYVVAYNFLAAPDAMRLIEDTMGVSNAIEGISNLCDSLPVPRSLGEVGFDQSALYEAAAEITNGNYPNPRRPTNQDVVEILRRAGHAESPFTLSA